MLTKLDVFTSRVTTPPFEITDGTARDDPIQIRDIQGLGPVNAAINTSQYGSVDGEFFNNAVVGKRNIVITLGINPFWGDLAIEDIRQILYTYFMPKTLVTLQFASTHMATVNIDAYVESFEPSIFAKDAEYQLSLICPSPYFESRDPKIYTGTTLAVTDNTQTEIAYLGTTPAGFKLTVKMPSGGSASAGEVRFYISNPDLSLFIVTATVNATQYFEMNTVQGNKYARSIAVSNGAITNLLGKVAAGSTWESLIEGPNFITVQSTTPGLAWTLEYNELYGGL